MLISTGKHLKSMKLPNKDMCVYGVYKYVCKDIYVNSEYPDNAGCWSTYNYSMKFKIHKY